MVQTPTSVSRPPSWPCPRCLTAVILTCALILVSGSSVRANDTLVTLGAGGLVPTKSSAIAMESEELQISIHQVTIRYVFRNDSDKDVDAIVAFPLPALDGGEVFYEPIDLPGEADLDFMDFKVVSDGKAIPASMEARAAVNGHDITARLQAAGVPVSVLLRPLNSALLKILPDRRTQLEREGLIVAEPHFSPGILASGTQGWWATWKMLVKYYWSQHFPAKSKVELEQTYRPVVGGSYLVAHDDGSTNVKPYCGGAEALRKIAEFKIRHPATDDAATVLLERRVQYILTTANNWNGPIRRFRLTVTSDTPDDIVLTCTPGLKRLSPTRYELVRSDFRPRRELDILVLQRNQ